MNEVYRCLIPQNGQQINTRLNRSDVIYTLPFASKFSLTFFIKEESWIAVSPAVPFHNLLPAEI